jgi:hypothetical protein
MTVTGNKIVDLFHPKYSLKAYVDVSTLQLNRRNKYGSFRPTIGIEHIEADGQTHQLRALLRIPLRVVSRIIYRQDPIVCINIDVKVSTQIESTGDVLTYHRQTLLEP